MIDVRHFYFFCATCSQELKMQISVKFPRYPRALLCYYRNSFQSEAIFTERLHQVLKVLLNKSFDNVPLSRSLTRPSLLFHVVSLSLAGTLQKTQSPLRWHLPRTSFMGKVTTSLLILGKKIGTGKPNQNRTGLSVTEIRPKSSNTQMVLLFLYPNNFLQLFFSLGF